MRNFRQHNDSNNKGDNVRNKPFEIGYIRETSRNGVEFGPATKDDPKKQKQELRKSLRLHKLV